MIALIDAYRGQFGVELICCTLWVAGFSSHVAIGSPKPGRLGPSDPRRDAHRRSAHGGPVELLRLRGQEDTHCHAAAGLADRPRTARRFMRAGAGPKRKPVFINIADLAAATPADLVDRRSNQPVGWRPGSGVEGAARARRRLSSLSLARAANGSRPAAAATPPRLPRPATCSPSSTTGCATDTSAPWPTVRSRREHLGCSTRAAAHIV